MKPQIFPGRRMLDIIVSNTAKSKEQITRLFREIKVSYLNDLEDEHNSRNWSNKK